ncbi:MAG: hypothetical protein OXF01_13260 [Gemmatimonadetes bacterium]|nr:hypothetical protein [Gemmatimonadota bacterium]
MTHYKRPYATNTICGEAAADADVTPFVEHVDCPECLRQLIAAAQQIDDPGPPAHAPIQIINRIEGERHPRERSDDDDGSGTILALIIIAAVVAWAWGL